MLQRLHTTTTSLLNDGMSFETERSVEVSLNISSDSSNTSSTSRPVVARCGDHLIDKKSSQLHPPSSEEFVRHLNILRPKILTQILSKTVVSARCVVATVEMVVEEEVHCSNPWYFTVGQSALLVHDHTLHEYPYNRSTCFPLYSGPSS